MTLKLGNPGDREKIAQIINERDGAEIKRIKDAFIHAHATGSTIEQLKKVAGDLLSLAPFTPIIMGQGLLYRALPFGETERCKTVKRMGYPPRTLAKQGRANRPKHQVLYVSTSPVVAVLEAQIELDQQFVLVEYGLKESIGFSHAGIFNSTSRDWISAMAKNISTSLAPLIDTYGLQNLQEAHRWIGELFLTADRNQYKLTTALAELLLMPLEGLIYPSLYEYRQYNMAIRTIAADRKLAPKQFWRGALRGKVPTADGEGAIQTMLHDHAVQLKGHVIDWVGSSPTVLPTPSAPVVGA